MLIWEILIVLLLILLNGYFAMSELAVVSARRARLQGMAEQGNRGARAALALTDDPGRFLSTVQVGITLVGVLTGAFGGATLAGYLAEWLRSVPVLAGSADAIALGLVVVAITYLTLIAGELVPKRIALVAAERIAVLVARPMTLLSRVAAPVVWLLQRSTDGVLTLLRIPRERSAAVTEDEVRIMIAEGASTGIFHEAERIMVERLLRIADRSVQAIMTPRFEIVWLDLEDDPATIRREIAASGHSRFPVCKGEIDEIVGIVQVKDLFDRSLQGKPFDVAEAALPPLVVHESTTILRLLETFRGAPIHMAIIVDEYGSVVGIATPLDVLTAITGELPEGTTDEAPAVVRRADGSWLIDGMLDIEAAEHVLQRRNMRGEHDFNTLGGFVLWQLGHLPQPGESFDWDGLCFEVVDMDGRRIDKVLVRPTKSESGDTPEPSETR